MGLVPSVGPSNRLLAVVLDKNPRLVKAVQYLYLYLTYVHHLDENSLKNLNAASSVLQDSV